MPRGPPQSDKPSRKRVCQKGEPELGLLVVRGPRLISRRLFHLNIKMAPCRNIQKPEACTGSCSLRSLLQQLIAVPMTQRALAVLREGASFMSAIELVVVWRSDGGS